MAFSKSLFIPSQHDNTLIQVILSHANNNTHHEAPGIIIAHPYGPLGGNVHNNVVMAIQRHFEGKGYVTACINFRGCGKSKGRTSWTAMPERDDYISVMDFLLGSKEYNELELPKINQLVLCGYSFGAMIAGSITPPPTLPTAYLLISLPLGVLWALATTKASFFKKQPAEGYQVLSIHGDCDQFTSTTRFSQWSKNHERHIQDVCVEGADHFWVNFEQELLEKVEIWRSRLTM